MLLGEDQSIFLAIYGDGIFPALSSVVPCVRNPQTLADCVINKWFASVRETIEHMFSKQYVLFRVFFAKDHKLLYKGKNIRKLVFNSFFVLNTYVCLNETTCEFDLRAPTLEQYLPLDEVIPPAQEVGADRLGKTFVYHRRGSAF
jgi:hypothetical protein